MKRIVLFLAALLLTFQTYAQSTIAIGEWKEHLSYTFGISVSEGNNRVYCATQSGIFILNKGDNSTTRLSKVNGLSDVEANVLNFNKNNNKLLIAYKNSNLDIVEPSGRIVNISDIKTKPIIGNKSINNIYFIGEFAYLSCGFGIVVIDMDRNEVKDTYYIGALGATVNVRDITSDGTNLYAACDGGIYTASLSNPNLANYVAWTKFPLSELPNGIYNTITSFDGKIIANYSRFIASATPNADSIFVYNGSTWSNFPTPSGYIIHQLRTYNSKLVVVADGYVDVYNAGSSLVTFDEHLYQYLGDLLLTRSVALDAAGMFWMADSRYGLVRCPDNWSSANYLLNGPASTNVRNMVSHESEIWVAAGGVSDVWGNLSQHEGVSHYTGSAWEVTKGNYNGIVNLDTLYDLLYLAVDPVNSNKVFVSSWTDGVVEITNKVPTKLWTPTNSSLQNFVGIPFNTCKTAGMAFDGGNNLWVCNPFNHHSLSFKRPNNTWQNIYTNDVLGPVPYLGQLLIDKNDQKWMILTRGGGLAVYKGGTTAAGTPANLKKLTTAAGNGKLPSAGVFCLAEDEDGEIWVGTDKGICVFYSPENVFTGANYDAQQILLEQDGHVQILLETETVLSIAVDDANRKWIGTSNSGVFLMSPDGTSQIHHFTESNSPLFSNDVKSITIDHKTGEVYFGTSKGILSYRGTSIEGLEAFSDVQAFPNPVEHGYDGPVAIKGLVDNTTLKITDISGSFVYEMKSEGGQAIWNATNFNGERVSTGVYMVFCTNEDGSQKVVTKILVIN